MSIYDDYLKTQQDEEKKKKSIYAEYQAWQSGKTPSQKAAEEQKPSIIDRGKQAVKTTVDFLKNWWQPDQAPEGKQPAMQVEDQQGQQTTATSDDLMRVVVQRNNEVRMDTFKTEQEMIQEYVNEVKKHPQLLYGNRPYVSGAAQFVSADEDKRARELIASSSDEQLTEIVRQRLEENDYQTTTSGDFGRAFETDKIKELKSQYNAQRTEQKMYAEILNKGTTDGDFREGLLEGIQGVPVVSDVKKFTNIYNTYEAVQKRKRGEPLTPTEQALVRTDEAKQFENILDPKGGGYEVGLVLGNMPYYALLFGVTKPVAKTVFGKTLTLKPIASLAVKHPLLAKTIAAFAGVSVQTVAGFTPQIVSKASEYTVDNYDFVMSEEGDILMRTLEEDKPFEQALAKNLPKAYAYQWIEVGSEYGGEVLDYAKRGLIIRYLGKNADKPVSEVAKILKQIGWDGLLNEVLEEEIANLPQSMIEGQPYAAPVLTEEGNKRLLTELVSIGLFGTVATSTASAANKARYNSAVNNIRTEAKNQGYTDEQIDQLVADFDTMIVAAGEAQEQMERAAPETYEVTREGEEVPAEREPTAPATRIETQGVVRETAQEPKTGGEFTAVNSLLDSGSTDLVLERLPSGAAQISAEGIEPMTILETKEDISLANVPTDIEALIREYAQEANKELITVESADQIARPEVSAPEGGAGARPTGQAEVPQRGEPTLKEIIEPFRTGGGAFVGTNVPANQIVQVATSMGRAAFFEGRPAAPAQSSEMMELIRTIPESEGRQAAMKAYGDAWMKANFEQPLEGKYKEGTNFTNEAGESVRVLGTDNIGRYRVQVTDSEGNVREELVSEEQLDSMTRRRGKSKPKELPEDFVERTEAVEKGSQQSKTLSNKIKNTEKYHIRRNAYQQEATKYISSADALNLVREYFTTDEVDVTFVDNISTDDGLEAFGKYSDEMITFVHNPDATTPEHEVVHAFLDLFVTPERKATIITQIKAKYGYTTDLAAEERIANDFIEYARDMRKRPFLRRLYDKIINFIRGFRGDVNEANKLYNDILNKKREVFNRDQALREAYFKKMKQKYKYTTKTLSAMYDDYESGQLGETASRQTLESYMKRKGVTKNDTEVFERTLKEYKKEPINVIEFMDSMRAKIMPLELIKTDRYATYSDSHLVSYRGDGGDQLDFDESETHLWNSPFLYTKEGHFRGEFTGEPEGSLETKPFTDPETGFKYVAVVRKGVQLTEQNMAQNVLNLARTQEEADNFIEKVTSGDTAAKGKGYGLFGHTRVGKIDKSPDGKRLTVLEDKRKNTQSADMMTDYYRDMFTFLDEHFKEDSKFIKSIKKWGENILSKKPTGRFNRWTSLSNIIIDVWEARNPSKSWSGLENTQKLNVYLSMVKEITGLEVPAANAELMILKRGLTTQRLFNAISFRGTDNSYDKRKDGFKKYELMFKNSMDTLLEYNYTLGGGWVSQLDAKKETSRIELEKIDKDIQKIKDQMTNEPFIPERYILENQSDPHQTTYPAETEWNTARLKLKKARKYLRFFESSESLDKKTKELVKVLDADDSLSWGRERYNDLNDVSKESLIEATIADINAEIPTLENAVTEAEKTMTPLEKQFFSVGSKFYERQIQEEVANIARELKAGQTAKVYYPTEVTVAVLEGFVNSGRYKVTDKGFVKVPTSGSDYWDYTIDDGLNLPVFDSVRDTLSSMAQQTPSAMELFYIRIDDKLYKVGKVENNNIYLGLLNESLGSVKYRHFTDRGIEDKSKIESVKDAKVGDTIFVSGEGYYTVSELVGKGFKVERGGGGSSVRPNPFYIRVSKDKLEKALDVEIGSPNVYSGDNIVLGDFVYEISDYNDEEWVELYGVENLYEGDEAYPPYEWDEDRDPEQGDEVNYDGERYTVVLAEGGELMLNPFNHTREINIEEEIESMASSSADDAISEFDALFPEGLTVEEAQNTQDEEGEYEFGVTEVISAIIGSGKEGKVTGDDVRDRVYNVIYDYENQDYDPDNFYSSGQWYWKEGSNNSEYFVVENESEIVSVNTPDYYEKPIEYKSDATLKEISGYKELILKDVEITEDIKVSEDQLKQDETVTEVKLFDADGQYIWDYRKDLQGRDNVIGVLNYTKQNSVPAFRKIRPDSVLVTDERGLQWWVDTVTKQDDKPVEVFQVKPSELQPKKPRKVTKTAKREPTVKEYAEAFFLARIPENELRVKSIQPAKTPEELKSKLDQLNKFAQTNAIFRRTGGKIQRGAAGQFSYGKGTPPQGEVRLRDKYIQDDAEYLAVLSHELGHALEFNMTGSTRTMTYKVFADSLTEEQTQTLTKELREVTKSLVGAEEMARRPIYYNRRTELLARFLEKMVLAPAELEDLAPTAVELFEQSQIRHPLIREYMEAAHEMIDKGAFKAILPDLRGMYQKHLGVRVGNIAFDREMVHRAMQERAKYVIEKFVKNKFKDVKDAPEMLFRAAEAIKITRGGKPVFGTRDYTKPKNPAEEEQLILSGWEKIDEQIEDGIKVPVYARQRYTQQEGQNIYNSLSEEGKQLIRDFTAAKDEARDYFNREMIKDIHNIEGDIEGWVYHYFEEPTSGTISKSLKFRQKKAGTRYKRGGKEGYVEDFQKAMTKVLIDLEGEKAFNKFITDQFSTVTKPIREGENPDKGWIEVQGSLEKGVGTPTEKRLVIIEGGKRFKAKQARYQMPKEIYERYQLLRGLAEEASTATRIVNSLNRYWRINILTHGGTAATNFISGGVQYSAKVLTDFYTEMLTGQVDMPQTRRNVSAMIKVLAPKGWTEASPDWVYGGDLSNYYGQFMSQNNKSRFDRSLDSYADKALKLFSTAERYWKKVISIAENSESLETLSKIKKTGLQELTKEEEKLIARINKEVDLYAYDYDNVPQWLEHHQRSTVGQAIKPFAKYPFKYFQQLTEVMIRPIFDGTLSWQERAAKLLAVATIMAAYAGYSDDRKKQQETPEGTEETPARLRTLGRVFLKKDEEGNELFLRVSKYPFINITEAGIQLINGNFETAKDVTSDMLGSIAPVGDAALLLFNYRNTYDMYTPVPVVLAESASSFLPLSRLLGDTARMLDPFRRKETTALQAGIGRLIPTTDEDLQRLLHGEVRTEKVPVEGTVQKRFGEGKTRTTTDRELKNYWQDTLLSMLTGLYVTRINPEYAKAYEIRAEENKTKKEKEEELSEWEQYLKNREENSGK